MSNYYGSFEHALAEHANGRLIGMAEGEAAGLIIGRREGYGEGYTQGWDDSAIKNYNKGWTEGAQAKRNELENMCNEIIAKNEELTRDVEINKVLLAAARETLMQISGELDEHTANRLKSIFEQKYIEKSVNAAQMSRLHAAPHIDPYIEKEMPKTWAWIQDFLRHPNQKTAENNNSPSP